MLKKIAQGFLFSLILTGGTILSRTLFGGVFSSIHVLGFGLIFLLFWTESHRTLWVALFSSLLLEPFQSTPFGTEMLSTTLTMMLCIVLYTQFVTNRSMHAAVILVGGYVAVYRLLGLLFTLTALRGSAGIIWSIQGRMLLLEIFATMLAMLVIYWGLAKVSRRLAPERNYQTTW